VRAPFPCALVRCGQGVRAPPAPLVVYLPNTSLRSLSVCLRGNPDFRLKAYTSSIKILPFCATAIRFLAASEIFLTGPPFFGQLPGRYAIRCTHRETVYIIDSTVGPDSLSLPYTSRDTGGLRAHTIATPHPHHKVRVIHATPTSAPHHLMTSYHVTHTI
jgi:hypothetical protein